MPRTAKQLQLAVDYNSADKHSLTITKYFENLLRGSIRPKATDGIL